MIFQKSIAAFRLILKKMKEAAQNFRKRSKRSMSLLVKILRGMGQKAYSII